MRGDFDYGDPENRKSVVERHLARIGLSLTEPTSKLAAPEIDEPEPLGPPVPAHIRSPGEFVLPRGMILPVSRKLARRYGYDPERAPAAEVPALPESISDDEAELRSLEESAGRYTVGSHRLDRDD